MPLLSSPTTPCTCLSVAGDSWSIPLQDCDVPEGRDMLLSLLVHLGEGLAHETSSINHCRNECMITLKERVQGIPQAGDSKADAEQTRKAIYNFWYLSSKFTDNLWEQANFSSVFCSRKLWGLLFALLWYLGSNTGLAQITSALALIPYLYSVWAWGRYFHFSLITVKQS